MRPTLQIFVNSETEVTGSDNVGLSELTSKIYGEKLLSNDTSISRIPVRKIWFIVQKDACSFFVVFLLADLHLFFSLSNDIE